MTCQEFHRIEPDYLAGNLSEAAAGGFETHAGSCAECEARLDSATRLDVSAFAPPLPPALRARTLDAVRTRRRAGRGRRWWAGGITAAAAAVLLALGVSRFAPPATTAAPVATAVRDTTMSPAVTLAMLSSRDEFAALDEAIRELEAALAASPNDVELRAFLASAVMRRAELQRQVQDAA